MSRRWAYNEQLMIGLKIERILKMIHKDANIIIKDDNDRIFYNGKRGAIFSTGILKHENDNDLVRLQIKHIEITEDDTFVIILYSDKYEEKHYSEYYYDDEFYNLAKKKWNNMIDRTTSGRYKCYDEVQVCEEWKDFSNYYEWFKNNWFDYDGKLDVDKDLIDKNSKIYSPKTCCIIPHEINIGIRISDKAESRGAVNWDERRQAYKVKLNVYTRHINTQRRKYKDALDLYFKKKDEFVKAMAEDFKDVVDKRVYDALMKYNSRELYLEKFGDYPSEYYE